MRVRSLILAGMVLGLAGSGWMAGDARGCEEKRPAKVMLKGEFAFEGKKDTLEAELTPAGGKYTVVYVANWGGKPYVYNGEITGDLEGEIKGHGVRGVAFDFSGKFVNGVAQCTYVERGGQGRSGTLTLKK